MLRFLFFLIPFAAAGQNKELFETYLPNVVLIHAHFTSNTIQQGFGIIVGEQEGNLFIATAGHLLHEDSMEPGLENPKSIEVRFWGKNEKYEVKSILYAATAPYDFGIIEVQKPMNFAWRTDCLGSRHEAPDRVGYIGRTGQWFYPTSAVLGQINKIGLDFINIDIIGLAGGSSGAPLVGKDGIIGLIISAESAHAEAITIERLREEVTRRETHLSRYQLTPSPFIQKARQSDLIAWNKAKAKGDIHGFYEYLNQHPNGKFVSAAKDSIHLLEKKEEAQRKYKQELLEEQQDWSFALDAKKLEIFQLFLEKHPNGKHAPEAKKMILELQPSFDIEQNKMILVEGGSFEMGYRMGRDGNMDVDSLFPHMVNINSFYLCKHEVTYKQFKLFVDATRYVTSAEKNNFSYIWTGRTWEQRIGVNWRHDDLGRLRDRNDYQRPVVHISFYDALKYCEWLTQITGKVYRLPTEAEWEFAARGGIKSKGFKFAGSNTPEEVAWCWGNSQLNSHDVQSLQPNELGLFDMSGNVWEWCSDWFEKSYYKNCPIDNPQGPQTGSEVVLRGGSWYFFENQSLLAFRFKIKPELSYLITGFRVARNYK